MSSDLTVEMDRLHRELDLHQATGVLLRMALAAKNPRELLVEMLEVLPGFSFLRVKNMGAAFLVDEQRRDLVQVASRNMKEMVHTLCSRIPVGHCLCGRAALSGTMEFASSPHECQAIIQGRDHAHGLFNVPILVEGKVEGLIVLYWQYEDDVGDLERIRFLESAASMVADVLKKVMAEQEMRRHEEMLRMVVDHAPCGIITVDGNGSIKLFNSVAERLFGYGGGEILGQDIVQLIPSRRADPRYEKLNQIPRDEERHLLGRMPFETDARRRDGTRFPIRLLTNQMTRGDGSSFISMIVSKAEEGLLFDEVVQLERIIIESAPFGIVVADAEERIGMFNAAAEHLFGFSRKEVIGRPVVELVPFGIKRALGESSRDHSEMVDGDVSGKTVVEAEAIRKDGRMFPIRLAVNRMWMEGKLSFVGMIADISEEKRLYSELVQSEKMAGLGSIVAGVAHEINSPVGIGVTAASELEERTNRFWQLLNQEGISEEELKEYLSSSKRLAELIRTNLERAADLVRSFKSVAVDQSSEKLRQFNLREYVESAILTLHHELKPTRLVVVVVCANDLVIRSDPGAFSQIVINLINNSRIHAFDPGAEGRITLEFHTQKDRLHFFYCDNGKGMTDEVRAHVFEPFFTTRRDLGGSGLGMHIVYNLAVQTLGGGISCQSAPGCGMSIHIDMPLIL
ncbi:MAG: PAS domain S-box protein [Magnetococcales bacterium]|nr:PAS domain S-box protein [Magnetococcales bacterium]MBF0150814.1 PAS domain S-box protein [Magnetococcales bacterium]MBF0172336.1 PAS domain S-box protein [Magnetococcales bacterium]MBF0629677.1 PAS domain S-box protein [Magnetococcales bacterium]